MKTKRKLTAILLAFCFCLGAISSGMFTFQSKAATPLSDWQGYWGNPVTDGEGVRVSTNATYVKPLSPEYIEFEMKIGALQADSAANWLKFGLGKNGVKDMDSNGVIYIRFWNTGGMLKAEALKGGTVLAGADTGCKVNDTLKVVIAKQESAQAWDVSINGTKIYTFTDCDFCTTEGKTYLGFASFSDGEDRANSLYYTINYVSNEAGSGSGESGNTGTGGSGNTGTGESGNTGTEGSGNTGSGESGNTGSGESGNTGSGESGNTGSGESGNTKPGNTTVTEKVITGVSIGKDNWENYWTDTSIGGVPPVSVDGGLKITTNSTLKAALNPEYIEFTMKNLQLKADSTDWIKFGFGDNTKDYDKWAGISFVLRNVGGKLGIEGLKPSVFDGIELQNVNVTDTLKFVFQKNSNGIWSLSVNGNKIADLDNIKEADFCTKDGKTYLGFASWADTSNGEKRAEKLNYTIASVKHMTTVLKTIDGDGNVVSVIGENGEILAKTGDTTPVLPWIICLAVVICGSVALLCEKKARRHV